MREVAIYDTTLRDGAQANGITFSAADKKNIALRLDRFGIRYIEGGWPGSNPVDDELFSSLDELGLAGARMSAFGSTRRKSDRAENDPQVVTLADSSAPVVCIFGKTWDFQVTGALRTTLEENLEMISDTVSYLKSRGKEVIFDAEHYFDGRASDRDYAMKCLRTAVDAGADRVVLCDTNGGTLPTVVREAIEEAVEEFGGNVGIHAHNDCGLAVANSLAAVDGGADMVQGTVNGIGERCGNADLCSIIPILALKYGMDLGVDLGGLRSLSAGVADVENVIRPSGLPFVGDNAFAHKGGMHVSAIAKNPRMYEHIPPESVGNSRRILVSEMAGRASISLKLMELGLEEADDTLEIVKRVKDMESRGYEFEGADASFELLVRKMRGEFEPSFDLQGFRVFIDSPDGARMTSEASVKVTDGDASEHTAADGDGPVDALNKALTKALSALIPYIGDIKLTDYKVRVLDARLATASSVRVLITSTLKGMSWTTVGVSQNVIEASLYALLDSVEYAVLRQKGGY